MLGIRTQAFNLGVIYMKLRLHNGYEVVVDSPQIVFQVCICLVKNKILQNLSFLQGVIIVLEQTKFVDFRHLHKLPTCNGSKNKRIL